MRKNYWKEITQSYNDAIKKKVQYQQLASIYKNKLDQKKWRDKNKNDKAIEKIP